jgi:hypothetical protein
MLQNALTVILDIRRGEENALRDILCEIGNDIRRNQYLRFPEFPTTHFARFVMIDDDTRLLFTSNHDDDLDSYLDQFITKAGEALDLIFGRCIGYPNYRTTRPELFARAFKAYIRNNTYPAGAFYVGYRGKTVQHVQGCIRTREKLQKYLNRAEMQQLADVLCDLPDSIPSKSALQPIQDALKPLMERTGNRLKDILYVISPLENKDSVNDTRIHVSAPPDLTEREYTVQNEMTVISDIDPARVWRLKTVLSLINLAAATVFNKGTLSDITTIHFARWVIYDNDRKLLFESNYDGSWEQYIGDFVDKGYAGLDGIWANSIGYPDQGARDMQAFKKAILDHQVRAQVFYSAYPKCSVKNILNDLKMAESLARVLDAPENGWLRRF